MRGTYPVGKLPVAVLNDLLQRYTFQGERIVVGARVGHDATVIDMGDRYLVTKSDPITFATDQIGWYVVNVNANDLACAGAEPRWFLCTVLLPESRTTPALVESIFSQIAEACATLNVGLVGGHTEITHDLRRPIVVGHMMGEVAKDRLVTVSGAQPGDVLLLTKGIAIEGTALIAREKERELRARGYDEEFLARAKRVLFNPGMSVTCEAYLATATGAVHAMHDPTEGGLATGLHELAEAANVGLTVDQDAIPILPECRRLCQEYGLHPYGTIASGSLLLAVAPQDAQRVTDVIEAAGVACTAIGYVLPAEAGRKIRVSGALYDLPIYERDEVTKIL